MTSTQENRFLLPAWCVSLAVHGVAVGLALMFCAQIKPNLKEEIFQWEVTLVRTANQEPTLERAEPAAKPPSPVARVDSPLVEPAPPTVTDEVPPPKPPQIVQRETPPVIEPVKPIEQTIEPPLQEKIEPVEHKVEIAKPTVEPVEQKVEPVIHASVEAKEPEPVKNSAPLLAQSQPVAPAAPTETVEARPDHYEPAILATATPLSHEAPAEHAASAPASHRESHHLSAQEAVDVPRIAESAHVVSTSSSPVQVEAPVQVAKAAASGPEVKVDHRWLAESLWRRVAELKRYPSSARLNGLEGKVVLKAVIRSDGHLAEVSVQKSSGHTVLDAAAMEAVRLACPLHMKHELGKPQIVVSLPIVYSLAN